MLNYCGDCLSKISRYRTCTIVSFLAALSLSITANQVSAQIMDTPADTSQQKITQQLDKAKSQPFEISSRIHLSKGTQTGYLVVEVKLPEGKHIYSMTQKGAIPPTTLKALPNSQIQLTGDFSPDKPATVIEKDPVFEQRVEKHTGKVQFFAPIKIDPAADLSKLTAQIQLDGQICSDQACVPIRAKMTTGKFAGYFDSTPAAASVAKQPLNQK